MLLDIRNLTLDYLSADKSARVLESVTLNVDHGETVGLVGESGSGKSSTARAAMRLLPSNARVSGRAEVCRIDVLQADRKELGRIRSRDVGFIQQDPISALNPVRRIGDSLTERLVQVHGTSRADAERTGLDLLSAVGLSQPEQRMRQYPHELSGGMLQRVVIAACLTTRPKLLFADEATSALDVTTQAEVLAILRDLQVQRGLGMLFITHDLHLAAAYCDRVYVMHQGRIVEELVGEDLFSSATDDYTRSLLSSTPTLAKDNS